jgi:hypothetical protein
VGVGVGVGVAVGVAKPMAWISARPTFDVLSLTPVTVRRTLVTLRGLKLTVVAEPELLSAGTGTVVPLENVRVAPVIWSEEFGRS